MFIEYHLAYASSSPILIFRIKKYLLRWICLFAIYWNRFFALNIL